jgi:hypothetical protein
MDKGVKKEANGDIEDEAQEKEVHDNEFVVSSVSPTDTTYTKDWWHVCELRALAKLNKL